MSRRASTGDSRIVRLRGSVADAAPLGAGLYELVRVGEAGLFGEVVRIDDERCAVQVYEDAEGLALGEPVTATGAPLGVELGPGLLGSVLDGIGRPLHGLAASGGDFLAPGEELRTLPADVEWKGELRCAPGDQVEPGDVVAVVDERGTEHRVMVPPGVTGRVARVHVGERFRATVDEVLLEIEPGPVEKDGDEPADDEVDEGEPTKIRLRQRWALRRPRPVAGRREVDRPFLTGQRIFDFLFPLAEGGAVAVPGGFGTGKTVVEQSLARHARADVVVFVGCGERGNEMAEVLDELPELEDPRTGASLLERTVMVVNTSNMPVVAREASIYLGMTIAEYYRDMGLRVALLVDSLSRWAEALREIASHLGEMPGEEGYPAYLPDRLGKLYERAGAVRALGRPRRQGSVTLVAAVSPPGGDLSEPVTQASLRAVGALWALDSALAHARQFPAVSWQTSYSLDADRLQDAFRQIGGDDWPEIRRRIFEILDREAEMREIAGLVGVEALQDADRLLLEAGSLVREHVLGQNAFHPHDAASSPEKCLALARLAVEFSDRGRDRPMESIDLVAARDALAGLRFAPEEELETATRTARRRMLAALAIEGESEEPR